MKLTEIRREIKRCEQDPAYFIENYISADEKRIQLFDYQKNLIKWLLKLKKL